MTEDLKSTLIDALVAHLRDRTNAEPAARFPRRPADVDHAGLYAWWADETALTSLSASLQADLVSLIYAGQAGATSKRTKTESNATLRSRIGGNHLRGNIRSSTFRKTISALLLQPLELQLAGPNKLEPASNRIVSEWLRRHLHVVTTPIDDRAALANIEHQILDHLNPPLNLDRMDPTPTRLRLTHLRANLQHPST